MQKINYWFKQKQTGLIYSVIIWIWLLLKIKWNKMNKTELVYKFIEVYKGLRWLGSDQKDYAKGKTTRAYQGLENFQLQHDSTA